MSAVRTLVTLAGFGLLGLGLLGRRRRTPVQSAPVEPPEPEPTPTPPPTPGGWTVLSQSEVTPALQAKAVEILHSNAPIGSMVPFTHEGTQYGGWVTRHGHKRAVELWRPA